MALHLSEPNHCAAWGARRAVERAVDMFASALSDRQERNLTLTRDRLGIKPLYRTQTGDTFLFGSELKALRAYLGLNATIDPTSLAAYLCVSLMKIASLATGTPRKIIHAPATMCALKWPRWKSWDLCHNDDDFPKPRMIAGKRSWFMNELEAYKEPRPCRQ